MPRGEKYRSTALQNIECISFSCIICIPLKQLSLTGPTKEKVMSGYPEFSLVARRRLLPAGGTRLERGEGRGGRWGCSGSRRDKKVEEKEEEEEEEDKKVCACHAAL